VELLVELYPRILDIVNFEVVIHVLDAFEVGCLYCRLGILNIFNPMKLEGAWEFEVRRREVLDLTVWRYHQPLVLIKIIPIKESVAAKIICGLATIEPGINWSEKQFRWKRDMDATPGTLNNIEAANDVLYPLINL